MKTIIQKLTAPFLSITPCLIGLAILAPVMAHAQQYRTVLVYENAVGPDGTPRAHVGDLVYVSIRVLNEDDFLDTITITNITDTVQHAIGDATGPNLVPTPVTLDSYELFGGSSWRDVTTSYTVLPDDGDYLLDHANVQGTVNFDGLGGTGVRGGFESTVGAQVRILHPSIQLAISSVKGANGLTTTYSGSVSNGGNTPLANVVVSNYVNGAFAYVLGPANLDAGQTVGFTGSYVPDSTGSAPAQTLAAWGTDELGLTVSNSVSVSSMFLTATRTSGGINLSWNTTPGRTYQVQYTTDLGQLPWNNLGNVIHATLGAAMVFDAAGTDANRFYRVVLVP